MSKAAIYIRPPDTISKKRQQRRLELRHSDGLLANIEIAEGIRIPVKIFDISILGMCIFVPAKTSLDMTVNSIFKIEIRGPDGGTYPVKVAIRWKTAFGSKGTRYGLEILRQSKKGFSIENSILIPEYSPTNGVIYKPYLFYERTNFRLVEVSPSIWTIKVYDTEVFVCEGISLDLFFNSSISSGNSVKVKVTHVLTHDHESVTLGVDIKKMPSELEEWLGQQLIYCCNITPEKCREIGLHVKSISNGFRFRYVKTQEEYDQVLQLRYQAYKEAGKVDSSKTYKDMVATLDHISRILAVYHGEKIVGSVGIAFPDRDDLILDTERAFENGYPGKIPPKTEVIEIARLCTHKDYRKTDLLNRIFEYTYKTLHCGDRKYILTSTDAKLWPLYKKLGFKKTGMSYAHPYLAGLEHFIIVGSRETPDQAHKISPLVWNYIWRDMNIFLEKNGSLPRNPVQRAIIWIYIGIGKILRINQKKYY